MGGALCEIISMKEGLSIVAGIDFSASSPMVLAHTAKIAAATGARVLAAHVIGSGAIREWERTADCAAQTAARVEEIAARLGGMLAEHCSGVPCECDVRIGNPPAMLARILTDHRADLLVLAAHDLTKRRLGTVAAACARSAPADVLILRDWQGSYFRRIAACVDFSPSSSAGLDRAITLADAHEASLEIIHVIFPPDRDPWGRVMDQPMDADTDYGQCVRERASAAMDEFLQPHAARLAKIISTVRFLESASPAAAISAHVEAAGIDLIVTGSHAGSWIEEFVLGSNTERLLHDASSSVLVARGWNTRGSGGV